MRAQLIFVFIVFSLALVSAQFDPSSACPLPKSPSLLTLSTTQNNIDQTLTANAELTFVNPSSKDTGFIPGRQVYFQKCGVCPTELNGKTVKPCSSFTRTLSPGEEGYDEANPGKTISVTPTGCCYAKDNEDTPSFNEAQTPISCDALGSAFAPAVSLQACSDAIDAATTPIKPFPCPTGCCYNPTQIFASTTDTEGKAQIILPLENVSLVAWFKGDNFYMPSNSTGAYQSAQLAGVNFAACFPLFLLLGLLMAAMHASGKSPFALIDFSASAAPRARTKAPVAAMISTQAISAIGKQIKGAYDAAKQKEALKEGLKKKEAEGKPGEGGRVPMTTKDGMRLSAPGSKGGKPVTKKGFLEKLGDASLNKLKDTGTSLVGANKGSSFLDILDGSAFRKDAPAGSRFEVFQKAMSGEYGFNQWMNKGLNKFGKWMAKEQLKAGWAGAENTSLLSKDEKAQALTERAAELQAKAKTDIDSLQGESRALLDKAAGYRAQAEEAKRQAKGQVSFGTQALFWRAEDCETQAGINTERVKELESGAQGELKKIEDSLTQLRGELRALTEQQARKEGTPAAIAEREEKIKELAGKVHELQKKRAELQAEIDAKRTLELQELVKEAARVRQMLASLYTGEYVSFAKELRDSAEKEKNPVLRKRLLDKAAALDAKAKRLEESIAGLLELSKEPAPPTAPATREREDMTAVVASLVGIKGKGEEAAKRAQAAAKARENAARARAEVEESALRMEVLGLVIDCVSATRTLLSSATAQLPDMTPLEMLRAAAEEARASAREETDPEKKAVLEAVAHALTEAAGKKDVRAGIAVLERIASAHSEKAGALSDRLLELQPAIRDARTGKEAEGLRTEETKLADERAKLFDIANRLRETADSVSGAREQFEALKARVKQETEKAELSVAISSGLEAKDPAAARQGMEEADAYRRTAKEFGKAAAKGTVKAAVEHLSQTANAYEQQAASLEKEARTADPSKADKLLREARVLRLAASDLNSAIQPLLPPGTLAREVAQYAHLASLPIDSLSEDGPQQRQAYAEASRLLGELDGKGTNLAGTIQALEALLDAKREETPAKKLAELEQTHAFLQQDASLLSADAVRLEGESRALTAEIARLQLGGVGTTRETTPGETPASFLSREETIAREVSSTADDLVAAAQELRSALSREAEESQRRDRRFVNIAGVVGYYTEGEIPEWQQYGIAAVNCAAMLAGSFQILRFGARDLGGMSNRLSGGEGGGDLRNLTLGPLVDNASVGLSMQIKQFEEELEEREGARDALEQRLVEEVETLHAESEKATRATEASAELRAALESFKGALDAYQSTHNPSKLADALGFAETVSRVSGELGDSFASVRESAGRIREIVAGTSGEEGKPRDWQSQLQALDQQFAPDGPASLLEANLACLQASQQRDGALSALGQVSAVDTMAERGESLAEAAAKKVEDLQLEIQKTRDEAKALEEKPSRSLTDAERERLAGLNASLAQLSAEFGVAQAHADELKALQDSFTRFTTALGTRDELTEQWQAASVDLTKKGRTLAEQQSKNEVDADLQKEVADLEARVTELSGQLQSLRSEGGAFDSASDDYARRLQAANTLVDGKHGELAAFSEEAGKVAEAYGVFSLDAAVDKINSDLLAIQQGGLPVSGKSKEELEAELARVVGLQTNIARVDGELDRALAVHDVAAGLNVEFLSAHAGEYVQALASQQQRPEEYEQVRRELIEASERTLTRPADPLRAVDETGQNLLLFDNALETYAALNIHTPEVGAALLTSALGLVESQGYTLQTNIRASGEQTVAHDAVEDLRKTIESAPEGSREAYDYSRTMETENEARRMIMNSFTLPQEVVEGKVEEWRKQASEAESEEAKARAQSYAEVYEAVRDRRQLTEEQQGFLREMFELSETIRSEERMTEYFNNYLIKHHHEIAGALSSGAPLNEEQQATLDAARIACLSQLSKESPISNESVTAIAAAQGRGVAGNLQIDVVPTLITSVELQAAPGVSFSSERVLGDEAVASTLRALRLADSAAQLASPSVDETLEGLRRTESAATGFVEAVKAKRDGKPTSLETTAEYGLEHLDYSQDLNAILSNSSKALSKARVPSEDEATRFSSEYARLSRELSGLSSPRFGMMGPVALLHKKTDEGG
ncbi:hypothetical protein HY992_00275 [Candidatus Micrarchaeota archaeon]|nr:hypothetical protein [Candidatus Micrarchaeota archaeon]